VFFTRSRYLIYNSCRNNGNTEGLFRGAFMQSGSVSSVGPLTDGQVYYDTIVVQTNCSGASDTLDCLRTVSYDSLKAAIDTTPSALSFQVCNDAFPRALMTPNFVVFEFSVASPSRWFVHYGKSSKSR
jgi:hypothetical protein